ncbi:hypothetical protein K435DRAFT_965908 [Dendrothele bispora CBS 962.96]|uniref:YDG domain-containing protein n=1 Tax=Dendrothele bispora (strain CBS 962.96) TaxID=1314807 RepID=A0A4S8M4G2_DENBC|nr:hypothetical protein K435DRAFT_965908 [Dendrothele bispora CBS 962.96]
MAPRTYGHLKEFPVGSTFATRQEMKENGMHPTNRAGIAFPGGLNQRACSIVVRPGEYGDDEDHGETIIYTGAGGNPNKEGKLTEDQKWSWSGNQNLRKCGAEWDNEPVRVIRGAPASSKVQFELNNRHLYPTKGFRYDGLYSVKKCVTGRSRHTNHKICKFTLERDPNQPPLPWLMNLREDTPESKFNPGQKTKVGDSDRKSDGEQNDSKEDMNSPTPGPSTCKIEDIELVLGTNSLNGLNSSTLRKRETTPEASSSRGRRDSNRRSSEQGSSTSSTLRTRAARPKSPRHSPYKRAQHDHYRNETTQQRRIRMASNVKEKNKLKGLPSIPRKKD